MDFDDLTECLDEGVFTLLIPLGAIVGAIIVQAATNLFRRVQRLHGTIAADCGLTGSVATERLLDTSGLSRVKVVRGKKSNHYHPWWREIRLLPHAFDGPSLASLATAAHEVGHARQFAENIWLCRLRRIFWPLCWAMPVAALLLCVPTAIGLANLSSGNLFAGILVLSAVMVVLQLPINLPLEYDASRRASQLVRRAGLLADHEQDSFDRILAAAWKTHAARDAQKCLIVLGIAVATAGMMWFGSLFETPGVALAADSVSAHHPGYYGPETPLFDPTALRAARVVGWFAVLGPLALLFAVLSWVFVQRQGREPADERPSLTVQRAAERNNEGMGLVEKGQAEEAISEFTQAIQLHPELMVAYFNRACAYVNLGRLDEALADVETALRLSPHFAEAMGMRGYVYLLRGEMDRANDDVDRALGMVPESVTALYCRGELWLARDEYERSVDDFTAALKRNPHHAGALRGRGLARYFQGKYDLAVEDLDEAIRLCPAFPVALSDRGAADLKRGEYNRAATSLRHAIQLAPDFANPYKHLAWLQATCPDPAYRDGQQAVANAQRALELTETHRVEWLAVLAAAHAEVGDFEAAVLCQTECLGQSSPETKALLEEALHKYQAGQPWREQPVENKCEVEEVVLA